MSVSLVYERTGGKDEAITVPAVLAGDLLLFYEGTIGDTGSVIPTGFTNIHYEEDPPVFSSRTNLSYKIATGSEGGSSLFRHSSSTNARVLQVFRADAGTIIGVTPGGEDGDHAQSSSTSTSTAASGGSAPLLAIGGAMGQGNFSSYTFSVTADDYTEYSGPDSTHMRLSFKVYESSPADFTTGMNDEGSGNSLTSCYLELEIDAPEETTDELSAGSFTLTGVAITEGRSDALAPGVFVLTGVDIGEQGDLSEAMGTGSFILTGYPIDGQRRDFLGTGTFVFKGVYRSPRLDHASNKTNRRVNNKWWAKLLRG